MQLNDSPRTTNFWQRKLKVTAWTLSHLSRGNLPLFSDSRYIIEAKVIPHFVDRAEYKNILFVGCAWFTRFYSKEYFYNKNYWTIDIDPQRAKYGSKQHIIDSVSNLHKHFPADYFDLIICTGVFGWGLNEKVEVERAFTDCYHCLRPEGIFILGWNNIPERIPFPLAECQSLGQFKPYLFSPLSSSQYLTTSPRKLTLNFYSKD